MPKEIKKYQCETCGAIFDSEETALNCEILHNHVKAVLQERHSTYNKNPSVLEVELTDGTVVEYQIVVGARL